MNRKRLLQSAVAIVVILSIVFMIKPQSTQAAETTSYPISPGESALVTSAYTASTTIYVKGSSFDYVKYNSNGEVANVGQEETSDTYTATLGQRVIVTNTSSGVVTLETKTRALNMSYTSTPALIKKWLAPGQSLTAYNLSAATESISVGGENDYADYDAAGALLSYAVGDSGGNMTIPDGERSAVTNRDTVGYEVFGAYEIFQLYDRATPAAFHWMLQPGETLQAVSHAAKSFTLHLDYKYYQYALYGNDGELDSYGYSSSTLRTISPLEKFIITNQDDEAMEVNGPYDGFNVTSRALPALYTGTLQNGESLKIRNISDKAYTLDFDGSYDFAEYNTTGEVVNYGKGTVTGTNSIAAGGYIVVTKSGTGIVEVGGPYDGFQFTASAYPALYTRSVLPGQSLEAANRTAGLAKIEFTGTYDYAMYDEPGGIKSYFANRTLGGHSIPDAQRIAFTNVGATTGELYAPYDAFLFSNRVSPVTFQENLAPGKSVDADNITAYSFSIAASGQNHYVVYDTGNKVSEFGRPTQAESYSISDTESLVLTNSGLTNITVSGPYDAFVYSGRTNPALSKTYLPYGSSLRLASLSPAAFGLDLEGSHDQASYMANGDLRSFDHKRVLSSLSLFSGERITITGSGSTPLQVITPFDVTRVEISATPALALRALAPAQSVEFTNTSTQTKNIEMTGTHDLMEYTISGAPNVYTQERTLSYKSLSAAERVAVENSDAGAIDVYGAYELFSVADRVNPVTFKRALSSGQSLDITNMSGKLFSIYADSLYDYAQYDGTGDAVDADREYGLHSKSVPAVSRLSLTAAGASVTVKGPYDVFTVKARSNPALFELALSPWQSMEAVYTGASEGDVHMTGDYDYSLKNADGTLSAYARNQSLSRKEPVEAGQEIAVENSDETGIVVFGAYDVFQASSRANPVTFHRSLAPGESMEAVNHTSKLFYLYPTGLHDSVQFDSTGEVASIDRANVSGTKSITAGSRIAITNSDAASILVEGAYDVYSVTSRSNPALFIADLQPGSSIEAVYTGITDADVKLTGAYDFALYEGSGTLEQYGHHYTSVLTQKIEAGKVIAVQNSDEAAIEVYGAYDVFRTQPRVNPVTFTRTLTSGESIGIRASTSKQLSLYFDGLFDYARYSGDGGVSSYNTWYTAVSLSLQGDDRMDVSPSEAQTVTVSGSYDGYTLTGRNARAVTVRTLQAGESFSVRNITPDSFNLKIDGVYDYQIYDLSGNMDSFGNDSSLASRTLGSTKRIVITGTEAGAVTLAVPTDAVRITDGDSEFLRALEFGETLEAVNTTNSAAGLIVSGKYDLAIYNASGNPYSFARETTNAALSIPAGYRAVLTSRQTAGTVVNGSQTAFRVTEQSNPALNVVKPGQYNTVQIKNVSSGTWSISADGRTDWVSYNGSGAVLDYALKSEASSFALPPSGRVIVTQPSLDGLALWGPYDAVETQILDHPALEQRELGQGMVLSALNLTASSQSVKVAGAFSYRIGEGTEGAGQSPLAVPAGAAALIRNTDTEDYQVFAPYGTFELVDYGTGTGPISGSGAAEQIAKLDPADYDPQSLVSDPVDTGSGAQIINRTLLTAHGAVPVPFQAQYHSLLTGEGALGSGWSHNFAIRLEADSSGNTVKVYWNDFRNNTFVRGTSGAFTSPDEAAMLDSLTEGTDGTYVLQRNDGSVYRFAETGQLTSLADRTGVRIELAYSPAGQLVSVIDPLTGAGLTLGYNAAGHVSTVTDQADRQISIAYDTDGRVSELTDAMGRTTQYAYDSAGRIVSATSEGVRLFENEFDSVGRIVAQQDAIAGGSPTEFAYAEAAGQLVTTVTDRNGHVQKRTHDAKYRLLGVEDELGHATTYTYDDNGNRASVTNTLNQTAAFTYDDRSNLLSAADHTGNTLQMSYDAQNNLLTATGPDGSTVVNTYDGSNRLLSVTDPESGTTSYTYDDNGLLLTAADPLSGTTQYTYTGNRLTGMQNAEGETIAFGYDSAGRLVSQTDGAGNVTQMAYNADDQLVTETNALGHTGSYTYDNQGFLATESDALGNITSYVYDGNGNITEVTNALDETLTIVYDGEGRMDSLTDSLSHAVNYTYDATGNLLTETNAAGESVRYVYDELNRMTEAYDAENIRIYTAGYDSAGNLVTLTDALDHTLTNVYDALNRITESTDSLQRTTRYVYDELSRLTAVTDPLQGQASRSFDALSRITGVTDPNRNTTGYTYDLVGRLTGETDASGGSHTYQYNLLGQLAQETNGRNQQTAYTYDAASRLDQFTDPAGSVSYSYDANGNVTAVSEGGKTLTRTFDALDRVEQYTDEDGNLIQYTYDADGNLSVLTYPDGKKVTYTYDAAGRMKTVTDWDNRTTTYGYDTNGQLESTQRPNGTVESRTYDANGQLTSLSDKRADGSILYEAGYLYDAAGNVVTETVNGTQTVTSSVYGAEPLIDINGPGLSPAAELFTVADAAMTYKADNRLDSYNGSAVNYDADGNMTFGPLQGSMQTYTYDARNRLTEAGGVSYGYNSENARTSVTVNGLTTKYVVNPHAALSQVLMEQDSQGQGKAWYVYGLGLISREDAAGNVQSYHYDRRGSTMALTDETGQVTDSYTYGNYGEALDHQGRAEQPFRYNGRDGVMT
ncbi:hypothetical protein QW71_33315, partial [Paenibacillus sp. IHB B 3415]|uniref:DUF6531 domain-containing protein n=1 Tax=Paenibacillus sp. IHB B 3415 TaxID=867080 RepID=UPI000575D9B7